MSPPASVNSDEPVKVYVKVLDEVVDVWAPFVAEKVGHGLFRLCRPVPEGESWEFNAGEVVRCEMLTFEDGSRQLVAVARLES